MRKSASRTREFGVAAYIAMLLVDAKVVGDIWPRRVIPGEQAEFRLCQQGFASTMRRPRGELSD